MMNKTTTRYDVAEHLRTPEELAAYQALWVNLSAKQPCNKATRGIGCLWPVEKEVLIFLNVHSTHASKQQGISGAKSGNDPCGDSKKGFERVETVGEGLSIL
jgi:hypothetical protein